MKHNFYNLTYKELYHRMSTFNEQQMNSTVTLFVESLDEFYPVGDLQFSEPENDVLDINHPYLVIGG